MMLPNPNGMTFRDWADDALGDLDTGGVTPIASDEASWREWASIVISFPKFSRVSAPNPYLFSNWRDWAERFNQTVESVV